MSDPQLRPYSVEEFESLYDRIAELEAALKQIIYGDSLNAKFTAKKALK